MIEEVRKEIGISLEEELTMWELSTAEEKTFKIILSVYAKDRDNIYFDKPQDDLYFEEVNSFLVALTGYYDFFEAIFPPVHVNRKMKSPDFYQIKSKKHVLELCIEGYTMVGMVILYCPALKLFLQFGHDKCLLFYTFISHEIGVDALKPILDLLYKKTTIITTLE
jgi:hypothetical protein